MLAKVELFWKLDFKLWTLKTGYPNLDIPADDAWSYLSDYDIISTSNHSLESPHEVAPLGLASTRMLWRTFGVLLFATSWVNCFRLPKYQCYFAPGNVYLPNRMALLSSPFPISESANRVFELGDWSVNAAKGLADIIFNKSEMSISRSEERRVGKEC